MKDSLFYGTIVLYCGQPPARVIETPCALFLTLLDLFFTLSAHSCPHSLLFIDVDNTVALALQCPS